MTLKEAKEEIPDFNTFRKMLCNNCVANDWYCPSDCKTLVKAKRLFEYIQDAYARHDGDLQKICAYINHTNR